MRRFVGRGRELEALERIFDAGNVKACMVYGRRRIGKTMMLRRFVEDKPHIYVEFDRGSTEKGCVMVLEDAISKHLGEDVRFNDVRHAMNAIGDICAATKTVVVFDELPYFTKSFPEASSELQHLVDRIIRETESMAIVCGSSISLMLEEASDSGSPLYGRFLFQMRLGPLTLEETRGFHPSMTDMDLLKTYLVLGGIAAYHDCVGDTDFRGAVEGSLLNRYGFIRNDVRNWISEEMGPRRNDAMALLSAISSGCGSYKDIKNRTGLTEYALNDCLAKMTSMGLTERRDSVIKSKKSKIYCISDLPAAFYYAVVERNAAILDSSSSEGYESMKSIIATHIGKAFEGFCREFVKTSYACVETGTWWGEVPFRDAEGNVIREEDGKALTEHVDIDVVAMIRKGNDRITLFGECKFTNAPTGTDVADALMDRAKTASPDANARYALFSPSGFTEGLRQFAEQDGRMMLFGLDVLSGRKDPPAIP